MMVVVSPTRLHNMETMEILDNGSLMHRLLHLTALPWVGLSRQGTGVEEAMCY